MVESKTSVYDMDSSPPLVEATPTMDGNFIHVDAMSDQDETVPLVQTTSLGTMRGGGTTRDKDELESIRNLEKEEKDNARTVGAGVATGVFGLLLGGPFLGLVLGFGAAYATEKDGAAGDTARAIGDIALSAKEKAKEIDEKHKVVEKTKIMASDAWEKAKDLDRQHHILERTKDFIFVTWTAMADFVRRHKLIERGVEGVGTAMFWVIEKLSTRNGTEAVPTTET